MMLFSKYTYLAVNGGLHKAQGPQNNNFLTDADIYQLWFHGSSTLTEGKMNVLKHKI